MLCFFNILFNLPGPVAAEDRALYVVFVQALADSALLEHTCKAAPRLAQLWEPGTSNCMLAAAAAVTAATAPAASGRGGCSFASSGLADGGNGSGPSANGGYGGTAGASSGSGAVARLRTEALQGCGRMDLIRTDTMQQPGCRQPQDQRVQAFLWRQMTSLLSRLEEVRAAQTRTSPPHQVGA